MHEGIIEKLYQEYTVHGFISEDHIFDVLEENGISLFDVEYICDHLLSKGVIIRDDAPVDDEDEEYEKPRNKGLFIFCIILNVILILILLWFLGGLLINLGVLPEFDLGYSWFNAHIYPLF